LFDLRYHVASLAAVFFALVIGILVGVALASHGLGNTERNRLEENLRRANSRGDALQTQLQALGESSTAEHSYVDKTYAQVMAGRLNRAKIAVLFVGPVQGDIRSAITRTLADAGAGEPLRMRAVTVPIDPAAIDRRLAKRPFLAAYAGPDHLNQLGHALGQELTAGTDTPLWNALETLIVEQKSGPAKPRADGIVVVRTAKPQSGPTSEFLQGLYSGIRDVGVPAVGVEVSGVEVSAMKRLQKAGLSTVDNLDTPVGRLALAILLSDPSVKGDFGTKQTAHDGVLPEVVAPVTTTGG
jgi:copper transport outer membrane protein MctB